jgi:hypothetical protein
MNTDLEPRGNDLDVIEATAEPSKTDDTVAVLEACLQKEIDGRNEDRFWFAFITVILFDMLVLPNVGVWSVPFFLLELIGLIYWANRCGLDYVVVALARIEKLIIDRFDKFIGSGK